MMRDRTLVDLLEHARTKVDRHGLVGVGDLCEKDVSSRVREHPGVQHSKHIRVIFNFKHVLGLYILIYLKLHVFLTGHI